MNNNQNHSSFPAGICLLSPLAYSPGLITDVLTQTFAKTAIARNNPSPVQDHQSAPANKNNQFFPSSTSTNNNDISNNSNEQYYAAMSQALHHINERKRQISETYLLLIEDTVDKFISSPSVGVQLKAIGDRYLDEPPTNMTLIRRNADLLANLAQDAFNPHSELNQHLIVPLVHRVYLEFLDPLRQELFEMWNGGNKKFAAVNTCASKFLETEEQKLIHLQNASSSSSSHHQQQLDVNTMNLMKTLKKLVTKCQGVYQDIEHIDQMRELDSHSTAEIAEKFKGGGLSHVVPIAGLALGRIHRLLNEHNTVIQHWGKRVNGGGDEDDHNNNHHSPPPAMLRRQF